MTNKAAFLQQLNTTNTSDMIDMLLHGACGRCSNFYWDWTGTKCHKNVNESSCEKGTVEYMDSEVGDNLQVKYQKKYIHCANYYQALILEQLAPLLFSSGVVNPDGKNCEYRCHGTCEYAICDQQPEVIQLQWMRYNHQSQEKPLTLPEYIHTVLVPKIEDISLRERVAAIAEMAILVANK